MLTVSCRPIFDVCLESVPRYGELGPGFARGDVGLKNNYAQRRSLSALDGPLLFCAGLRRWAY